MAKIPRRRRPPQRPAALPFAAASAAVSSLTAADRSARERCNSAFAEVNPAISARALARSLRATNQLAANAPAIRHAASIATATGHIGRAGGNGRSGTSGSPACIGMRVADIAHDARGHAIEGIGDEASNIGGRSLGRFLRRRLVERGAVGSAGAAVSRGAVGGGADIQLHRRQRRLRCCRADSATSAIRTALWIHRRAAAAWAVRPLRRGPALDRRTVRLPARCTS